MVAEERSRVAPGVRPPTDRAGRATSLGVDGDKRDGAGSHLASGHPPTAPAARPRLEWMVTRGRRRVAPGVRPPTDRARRAGSLGAAGDNRDGAGARLGPGQRPTAPAARAPARLPGVQ